MRVLTWNIQWALGADGRVDPERIARYLDACGADIIALQEVAKNFPKSTGDTPADQPAWFAERFTTHTCVFGAATDIWLAGQRRQFGNLILSRYPIRQVFTHRLPRPADSSALSSERGAIEALIDTPLGLLRFTSCHLEYFSPRQRLAQAEYLRNRHIEACEQLVNNDGGNSAVPAAIDDKYAMTPMQSIPGTPRAIVCGDFNAAPQDPALALLTQGYEPGLRDLWPAAHPGEPHRQTLGLRSNGFDPKDAVCFDYMFATNDLLPRLQGIESDPAIAASDHQPLWADFE